MAAAGSTLMDNITLRRTGLNIFILNQRDKPRRLKIDELALHLVFIGNLPNLSH
jgi:hypothetical protein